MFKNKDLKRRALSIFRKNKWTLIIISILMTVVIGEYALARDSQNNAHIINQIYQDRKNGEQINVIEVTESFLINKYATEMLAQLASGQNNTIANLIKYFNEKNNVNAGNLFEIADFFIKGQEQVQGIVESSTNMSLEGSEKAVLIIAASIGLFIKIFITDPLIIGEKRVFLESIYYEKTKIQRVTYPFQKKKYLPIVGSMILYRLYSILWRLTIVIWPVKAYSYKMIQFIVAENPKIKPRDAIKMSKEMMKGYKWQTFKLDLSFLGWFILQYITLGIAGLFVTPYYVSTYAVLYENLREEYIKKEKYNYELLNDEALFIKNNQPIYLVKDKKKREYKFPELDLTTIVIFFFLYSILGYLWEVALLLFKFGRLVNRGALYGPWLPIYGLGCSFIMLLFWKVNFLKKFGKNPFITFIIIMVLCSALEYGSSWLIEKLVHLKYWDYTGYFININGRTCLENGLFFGIGGILTIYIVAPFVYSYVGKIRSLYKIALITFLMIAIIIDLSYSLKYPHQGDLITEKEAKIETEIKTKIESEIETNINSNLYIQI